MGRDIWKEEEEEQGSDAELKEDDDSDSDDDDDDDDDDDSDNDDDKDDDSDDDDSGNNDDDDDKDDDSDDEDDDDDDEDEETGDKKKSKKQSSKKSLKTEKTAASDHEDEDGENWRGSDSGVQEFMRTPAGVVCAFVCVFFLIVIILVVAKKGSFGVPKTNQTVTSPKFLGNVSMAEVQKHNTTSDCWVVYFDEVYDMTYYAPQHPTGASYIQSLCGQDGTMAYTEKHPKNLLAEVESYFIGDLMAASPSLAPVAGAIVPTPFTPGQGFFPPSFPPTILSPPVLPLPGPLPVPGPAPLPTILSPPVLPLPGPLLVPGPPPLPLPGPLPVPGPPPLPLTPLPTAVGAPCTVTAYTQSELSKHNQSNDLWVAIQGSVYDLTSYAPTHPNGPQSILAVAGTDATGSFSQYHQPAMLEQAAPYKIGILSLFSGQVPCWN